MMISPVRRAQPWRLAAVLAAAVLSYSSRDASAFSPAPRAQLGAARRIAAASSPTATPPTPTPTPTEDDTDPAGTTALSDSFEGAVGDASASLIKAVADGCPKIRLDFDTTLGDATYTTLKSSMTFSKAVARAWAEDLGRSPNSTLAIWFPDAGSAALAQEQWKDAPLPDNCRMAAFPRDKPRDTDTAFLVICPRAIEAGATEALVDYATDNMRPVALINPSLVDMGTTGFGLAGRMLKNRLINTLEPAYYLRTLEWGAIARNYPLKFTVWNEDAGRPDGYRFLRNYDRLPNGEELEELYYEEVASQQEAEGGGGIFGVFDGVGRFIENFQRM